MSDDESLLERGARLMGRRLVVWRTGRKVGRTIYRQLGDEPSDDDELVGVMDTPELAQLFVDAANRRHF